MKTCWPINLSGFIRHALVFTMAVTVAACVIHSAQVAHDSGYSEEPLDKPTSAVARIKFPGPVGAYQRSHLVFRTSQPPQIDADLNDSVWQGSTPINDFSSCGGLPVHFRTEVRLAYDDAYLYLSFVMEEPDFKSAKASIRRRDGEVWRDDRAEVFVWIQEGSGAAYYQLMANMLGTTEDAKNLDASAWDPKWDCSVKVDKANQKWVLEARIAFSEFGVQMPPPGTIWRMNFGRERFAVPDHYSWAKIAGSFHQKEAFNAVAFCGEPRPYPNNPLKDFGVRPGRHFGEVDVSLLLTYAQDKPVPCCSFEIRYSKHPIETDEAFERALKVEWEGIYGSSPERHIESVVSGLDAGGTYYFAARAAGTGGSKGQVSTAGPVVVPGGQLNPDALTIEPTLKCAGVLLNLGSEDMGSIRIDYRKSGEDEWQKAHPLTRVDLNHSATSLFHLAADTAYEVRISMRSGESLNRFRTRRNPAWPTPLRIINVHDSQALARSLAGAQPGDEILVHPGVYSGGFAIRQSGTEDHPIVIRGSLPAGEGAKPIWMRRGLPVIDGAGRAQSALLIEGTPNAPVKHVAVSDLQIRNGREIGIHLNRAGWCTVQNCQIYDNGSYANVHVNKGGIEGGRHLIRFNHIADLDHPKRRFLSAEQNGVTYYGFKQDNHAGPGTVFCGNRVEGHSDGVSSSGDESESGNVAEFLPAIHARWFNHSMDVCDNEILDHSDDAIEADGIGINQRFFDNRIRICQNAISIAPSMPGPFFFLKNTAENFQESSVKFNTAAGRGTIRNIYFYHNTFRRGDGDGRGASGGAAITIWRGTPSKNVVFRNNIFSAPVR